MNVEFDYQMPYVETVYTEINQLIDPKKCVVPGTLWLFSHQHDISTDQSSRTMLAAAEREDRIPVVYARDAGAYLESLSMGSIDRLIRSIRDIYDRPVAIVVEGSMLPEDPLKVIESLRYMKREAQMYNIVFFIFDTYSRNATVIKEILGDQWLNAISTRGYHRLKDIDSNVDGSVLLDIEDPMGKPRLAKLEKNRYAYNSYTLDTVAIE